MSFKDNDNCKIHQIMPVVLKLNETHKERKEFIVKGISVSSIKLILKVVPISSSNDKAIYQSLEADMTCLSIYEEIIYHWWLLRRILQWI